MKRYWEEISYEYTQDSSGGLNGFILLILSIDMLYYQRGCNMNHKQVSSAQTNKN